MLDKLQEYSMKALIWAGILFWPFIILTLLIAPLFANADDNVISLEQSGDNLQLGVDQYGYNNNDAIIFKIGQVEKLENILK